MTEEQRAKELVNGSEDDIYFVCASAPDSAYPINDDGLRVQREIGYHKIGYCKDLPYSRKRASGGKGCYYHDMWCTDPLTNWAIRLAAGKFICNAKA